MEQGGGEQQRVESDGGASVVERSDAEAAPTRPALVSLKQDTHTAYIERLLGIPGLAEKLLAGDGQKLAYIPHRAIHGQSTPDKIMDALRPLIGTVFAQVDNLTSGVREPSIRVLFKADEDRSR